MPDRFSVSCAKSLANKSFFSLGFTWLLCGLIPVLSSQSNCCGVAFQAVLADGPADNSPDSVRPVPPPGEALSEPEKNRLLAKVKTVRKEIAELVATTQDPASWVADVEVLPRSVDMAIEGNTFYDKRDVGTADLLLDLARSRMQGVRDGLRGLELLMMNTEPKEDHYFVIGGFRSKIDGSIQPYGLMVPTQPVVAPLSEGSRLDVWLHGRGERELELQFLGKRLRDRGYYAPAGAYVLHPFGRYSNAFKFAGEVDVFEAIDRVEEIAKVDPSRISIRGFSMGGAGCWQLAVHYPGYWMAATPGAGFCETMEFLRFFQGEDYPLDEATRKLLSWYDCPPSVNNLRNFPVVAYSGEVDRQRQAAELMVDAAKSQGFEIPHLIGPETGHSIHADSKAEISRMMETWSEAGRPLLRKQIDWTTYTLRYSQCDWIEIMGLQEHWKESRVRGSLNADGSVTLETKGVTALKIALSEKQTSEWTPSGIVRIDGEILETPTGVPGSRWEAIVRKDGSDWRVGEIAATGLRKAPGLQGPIDDAFLDSFVVVKPTGVSKDPVLQKWISEEIEHVRKQWRLQFRGDLREVNDTDVTPEIIANNHLVLFGDPASNRVMSEVISRLPITWDAEQIRVGNQTVPVGATALAIVYPNPMNPNRYVVFNSGFTYRPYAYLNNARQIPHLPDWAMIDISNGANSRLPGRILISGFFDESWKPVAP